MNYLELQNVVVGRPATSNRQLFNIGTALECWRGVAKSKKKSLVFFFQPNEEEIITNE